MRGNGSGFYENGFFAKTTTSDLILKESAGTGLCQNNSEICKDHPPGLAAGPQAEPHSQIPNRLRGRPPTLIGQPHSSMPGGHREGLGMLKQNPLSTASHSPAETPPLRTHTQARAHIHPNFQKALGTAHLFLSRTELLEQDLPSRQAAFFIPSPLPSLLQSQGFVRSFKGMTGGEGATDIVAAAKSLSFPHSMFYKPACSLFFS